MNRDSIFAPDVYDYHIGWICATTQDYGAACKVLDQEYRSSTSPLIRSDRTSYKLGRIGDHNVAINIPPPSDSSIELLPENLARNLNAQFPSIRFFLMTGCDGAANTENSIELGDVVIGTKVVPYNTVDDQKKSDPDSKVLRPPYYLLSALTVLFEERLFDGSGLQRSIDAVIDKIPNHNGRYQRPRTPLVHSTQGRIGYQPNSSHYRREVEHQESQPNRSTAVFQGGIASQSGSKATGISRRREQNTLRKDILCVESGSADILAAGFSCLPILGISSDVRGHGHRDSDWSHYAALAAAVCSKEVLASINPDVVSRAESNMSSNEVDVMVRDNMKMMQRYIREACLYGQPQRILLAAQVAEKRVDELEVWMSNLSVSAQQPAKQQLADFEIQMESIKRTEDVMRDDMEVVKKQIQDLMNDPANSKIREELKILKETVTNHASRLETLSQLTDGATGIAVRVLDQVGLETNNPNVQKANVWIKFVRGETGEWRNIGSKMNWRSNTTETTSSGSPKFGSGSSVPQETPQTKNKMQTFMQTFTPSRFVRQPSAPTGISDIGSGGTQNQDSKPPRAKISSGPLPLQARSYSPHTAPGPQSSDLPNYNTSKTSLNPGRVQDHQHPKPPRPNGPLQPRSSSPYTRTGRQSSSLHNSNTSRTSLSSGWEDIPRSSIDLRSPSTRVDSEAKFRNLEINRANSDTPSLHYQASESSIHSANEFEVDDESVLSVKQRAEKLNQGGGGVMGWPHQRRGNHGP